MLELPRGYFPHSVERVLAWPRAPLGRLVGRYGTFAAYLLSAYCSC